MAVTLSASAVSLMRKNTMDEIHEFSGQRISATQTVGAAESYADATPALNSDKGLHRHLIGAGQNEPEIQGQAARSDHLGTDLAGRDAHNMGVGSELDPPPGAMIAPPTKAAVPQAAEVEEIAAQIRILHRRASFCTAQRVTLGNRLAAFVRTDFLGFSTFDDETSRAKACREAAKMISTARKGGELDLTADQAMALKALVTSSDMAAAAFEELEERCLKQMVKLARKLPGHSFVAGVRGFGDRSFARIVGESGPLHRYANPAKLWKRLGLAVIGGERQRRYSDAEMAALHGYNPRRRSVSWVAFDSLLKGQGLEGPYRVLYDRAKAGYLERGWTKMHSHRAAARYAEKKLLLHLWRAWSQELRGHHVGEDHGQLAQQAIENAA